MLRKRFYVKINVRLQTITCPGVWLCTHGYLEATVKALGYFFRTGAMEPRFPLLCHDQFTMEGYFKNVGSMTELEEMIAGQPMEITLWQNGRRLAYFMGFLSDIMEKQLPQSGCSHDVHVQLLMKATTAFPGIISPKVELSATVHVKDRLQQKLGSLASGTATPEFVLTRPNIERHCSSTSSSCSRCASINPRRRQKPVCHANPLDNASKPCSSLPVPHSRRLSTSSNNTLITLQSCDTNKSSQDSLGSHGSLSSYNNSSSHSDCHRSLSFTLNSSMSMATLNNCQQNCTTCQNYRQVFS